MAFLELILQLIFEILFVDLVRWTGILVRWSFVAVGLLAMGREVTSLRQYNKKMTRDRDPSNKMSDGIIHWLLGAGTWAGVIFLLI